MNKVIGKRLAALIYATTIMPIFFLKKNHHCEWDDCLKIFADGELGICVQKAIDDLSIFFVVLWFWAVLGSSYVLARNRKDFSPFLFLIFIIAIAFLVSLVDPSKLSFSLSLLPSFLLLALTAYLDAKELDKAK